MLGKLIKNEWISTWKVPTILCIYLGVLTLVGCVSFLSPIWETQNPIIESLLVVSAVIYFLSLFASVMIIFVYFVVRFYRNMYTDEGYLMHTLPVTAHEHVLAKGLVFLIWEIISAIVVVISVFAVVLTIMSTAGNVQIGDLFHVIKTGFPILLSEYYEATSIPFSIMVIWTIFLALAQAVSSIAMIYGAISIGQTFHKYRVMASVGAYFALSIILQTISSVVSLPVIGNMIENINSVTRFIVSTFTMTSILVIITCGGFYILTVLIMKKQLNLE